VIVRARAQRLVTFHLPRESRQLFAQAFFIFFEIHFSNSGEPAEARAYAVFASDLLLRDDPVTRLRPFSPRSISRGSAAASSARFLTRISASFGTAARELSQNGNWIRVMCLMESFEPPRSVPSDALTIVSASSGVSIHYVPSRKFVIAISLQDRIRLVDQTDPSHAAISPSKVSITLNSDHTQPLVVRMVSQWQAWSANINPIENSVVSERPPSICSISDTLWQQRITAAFGARPKFCCFGNPRSAVA
jgi:hypothetical protein